MSTSAVMDRNALQIEPGEEAHIAVTIRNDSSIVESYSVSVVGTAASWARVDPETVSIYPGKSEVVTVSFRPPRSAKLPAGEVAFGVRVVPSERPEDSAVPEGIITVSAFRQTEAELAPRMSRGGTGARIRLAVDNFGNVPLSATISATDPAELLSVVSAPTTLPVGPGAVGFGSLRIRPKKLIWRGQPVTHPYEVSVSIENQATIRLDGTYQQLPLISRWVVTALAALLAVLVVLAVLWFTVARQGAEAGAENAAEESASEAAGSAAAAQDSAIAAQEAAKIVSELLGQSQPTLTVAPTTIRLVVSSPADEEGTESSNTFPVPADRTLQITDLFFSNPQGDSGTLVLLRGEEELYRLGLENFRDLDFHFQTPIEVAGGGSITLQLTCSEVGSPPDEPTECAESLLVSASLITRAAEAE